MKLFFLTISLLFSLSYSFSQDLYVGGSFGVGLTSGEKPFTLAPTIEFSPSKASFSVNSEVQFLLTGESTIVTIPFYLKVILGKRFQVNPTFGAFVRTTENNNYGWTAGLSLEYKIKSRLLLFLKGDFYKDYWKESNQSPGGSHYTYTESGSSVWIAIGIKRNLIKIKE